MIEIKEIFAPHVCQACGGGLPVEILILIPERGESEIIGLINLFLCRTCATLLQHKIKEILKEGK